MNLLAQTMWLKTRVLHVSESQSCVVCFNAVCLTPFLSLSTTTFHHQALAQPESSSEHIHTITYNYIQLHTITYTHIHTYIHTYIQLHTTTCNYYIHSHTYVTLLRTLQLHTITYITITYIQLHTITITYNYIQLHTITYNYIQLHTITYNTYNYIHT